MGGNARFLAPASATRTHAGSYTVVVSNRSGRVTSFLATLTYNWLHFTFRPAGAATPEIRQEAQPLFKP